MNKINFQCIIIGAGPAGARAAYELSKTQKDILIIDYRNKLGDKLCTGIIGINCADEFGLDKDLIYHEANSADIYSPDNNHYSLHSKDSKAMIIDRIKYVQRLTDLAKNNGVKIYKNSRVQSISINNNKVQLSYKSLNKIYNVTSKTIIIASGLENKLLTDVNLKPLDKKHILNGSQVIIENHLNIKNTKVFLGSKYGPQGFGWTVPVNQNKLLIGVLTKGKSKEITKSFMKYLLDQYQIDKSGTEDIKTWGIPIKPINKSYAERTLVIGDAAGLVKPITGGGIYYSQLSGKIAAEIIDKALSENSFNEGTLSEYEIKWKNKIDSEIKRGNKMREILFNFSDQKLSQLLNFSLTNKLILKILLSKEISFDNHFKSFEKFIYNKNIIKIYSDSKSKLIKSIIPSLKKHILN